MPTCLDKPEKNDCYDDVAMAIEQTRGVFAEASSTLNDCRGVIRAALAFRIGSVAPGEWPAALDPMRAALAELLAHLDDCAAIAEAEVDIPSLGALDDRLAVLEQEVVALRSDLARRE
jgi:hypothetical protein